MITMATLRRRLVENTVVIILQIANVHCAANKQANTLTTN